MRGFALLSLLAFAACFPAKKPPADPSDATPKEDMSSDWTASAPAATKPTPSDAPSASSDASPPPSSSSAGSKGVSTSPSVQASPNPPPSHPADNGPHVPSSVGGPSYDRASLEVVLKRAARQVKANCGAATDDSGNASGPWGKTAVTVKLGHNGHSKGGTIPAPFDGKATGNCSVKAFGNLIYEPFAGSDADVDWPVEILKP
jgi:cytoskeletal protein RodZ